MITKFSSLFTIIILSASISTAQFGENPFKVSVGLKNAEDGSRLVVAKFTVPKDHILYESSIKVSAPNNILGTKIIPPAVQKKDSLSGKMVGVYKHDFQVSYTLASNVEFPIAVTVDYQGCSGSLCFMPQTETFKITASGNNTVANSSKTNTDNSSDILAGFKITGTDLGYKKTDEFIAFIDRVEAGKGISKNPLREMLEKRGVWVLIIFILLGGLALNLTPCVLPMIPINIAIIGAGTQAGSRSRGFGLGAVYGLGIAIVYGILGLVVVLTGSQFGTLNSSPWFNLGIAILFLALSLALFDVFSIDFSHFQSGGQNKGNSRGPFLTAFVFGGVAALLAGACVAPVLIGVLILSTEIYKSGTTAGLLLPFLLGLGMALPWPFAGAGLSFLPKPGKWMKNINRVFGVIILLAAIYYGWLGVKLLTPPSKSENTNVSETSTEFTWLTSLDKALEVSQKTGKPVFVDVWATWCKSCEAMSATTFKDPSVLERLKSYVPLKYQADNPKDPATKRVLEALGVKGQPFYVVLQPTPQKP